MFLVEFKPFYFLFSAPSNYKHFETQRLMGCTGMPLEADFSRLVISAYFDSWDSMEELIDALFVQCINIRQSSISGCLTGATFAWKEMDKMEWIELDPFWICPVLTLLGDEGGSGQRSFSSGWTFCNCGAQQRLGSCLTIAFLGKKMNQISFSIPNCWCLWKL